MWEPVTIGEVRAWRSSLLNSAGVAHAFTGSGGNLSASQGPGAERATTLRRSICAQLALGAERLVFGQQVHGAEIAIVGDGPVERGFVSPGQRVPHVDGLITDAPGVPLMALSADCPAVLVIDPGDKPARTMVLGIAHAGWRGAAAGIVPRLVGLMCQRFDGQANRMMAALSPSAGPCCYEIREDVVRVFGARGDAPAACIQRCDGRTYLDLWSLLDSQLAECGLRGAQRDIARCCSICDERFFSFRRDGAATGHAGLIAGIRA